MILSVGTLIVLGTISVLVARYKAVTAWVSEKKLSSVLQHMSEGVMLIDAKGNAFYQNPASLRIHGFDPSGKRVESENTSHRPEGDSGSTPGWIFSAQASRQHREIDDVPDDSRPKPRRSVAAAEDSNSRSQFAHASGSHEAAVLPTNTGKGAEAARCEHRCGTQSDAEPA